jgi:hypothetical protein
LAKTWPNHKDTKDHKDEPVYFFGFGFWLSAYSNSQRMAQDRRDRRQEMAEDSMHGGWREEEREKKRLEKLRKAKRSRKRNTAGKKGTGK